MKAPFLSKKGVSMVELVITMLLLAIVATSTFGFYAYVNNFSIKSENYAAATEFLTQTLEMLLSKPYADPGLSVTTDLPPHYDPLSASNLRDQYNGVREYSVDESTWDSNFLDSVYKAITVTIRWNDGVGRALTLSVRKSNLS